MDIITARIAANMAVNEMGGGGDSDSISRPTIPINADVLMANVGKTIALDSALTLGNSSQIVPSLREQAAKTLDPAVAHDFSVKFWFVLSGGGTINPPMILVEKASGLADMGNFYNFTATFCVVLNNSLSHYFITVTIPKAETSSTPASVTLMPMP